MVGQHLQVASGFGGGIRTGGGEQGVLGAGAGRDRAVDLVGGHLDHARDPHLPDGLEQGVSAQDVGAQERLRVDDGAVDVRLGGEVDDRVHSFGCPADRLAVADVAVYEPVARVAFDGPEIVGIAGIGELVQIDDLDRLVPGASALRVKQAPDEVGADEAGATADQDLHPFVTVQS